MSTQEKYDQKKSFAPKLFFFIVLLSAVIYYFYPVIAAHYPDVKQKVDNFRGYYAGPLFIDKMLPGSFTLSPEGKTFYFAAAANEKYGFSIKLGMDIRNLGLINLYKKGKTQIITTNSKFPYATGRQADAFSAQGSVMPEHANYLTAELSSGERYVLEILPKEKSDIGKKITLNAYISQDAVSIEYLWGYTLAVIVVLFILFYIAKAVLFIRRNKK